jgi:uncharacterized membrane protein YhaH (DUF805 family)
MSLPDAVRTCLNK